MSALSMGGAAPPHEATSSYTASARRREAQMRLEAHEPPEVRGEGRDDVALLVSNRRGELVHTRFRELPRFLGAGDLLVVNTSATLPAALGAGLDGEALQVRLSTAQPGGLWIVEAASKAAVLDLMKSDPFYLCGLRQAVEVLHWSKALEDKVLV